MNGLVTESLAELVGLLVSAVAAAVLTTVGVLVENAGFESLAAGQSMVGIWELWMGAIALYAGLYLLGYKRVVGHFLQPNSA